MNMDVMGKRLWFRLIMIQLIVKIAVDSSCNSF